MNQARALVCASVLAATLLAAAGCLQSGKC